MNRFWLGFHGRERDKPFFASNSSGLQLGFIWSRHGAWEGYKSLFERLIFLFKNVNINVRVDVDISPAQKDIGSHG
jgi:hypothetical protein